MRVTLATPSVLLMGRLTAKAMEVAMAIGLEVVLETNLAPHSGVPKAGWSLERQLVSRTAAGK